MKKAIKYILLLIGLIISVKGILQLVDSSKMSESSGLGGYAIWASGMIFLIAGVLLIIILAILHYKSPSN